MVKGGKTNSVDLFALCGVPGLVTVFVARKAKISGYGLLTPACGLGTQFGKPRAGLKMARKRLNQD